MPITTLEAGKVDKKPSVAIRSWMRSNDRYSGPTMEAGRCTLQSPQQCPTTPTILRRFEPHLKWHWFFTLWIQDNCTLHLSGPTLGEGCRWSQWPGLQGVKRHLKSTEAEISRTREGHLQNCVFSGWRSSLDAQHRPEPSCTCWSGCQGVAQLIDLWTYQFWKGLKIVRSRNRDSNISETTQLFENQKKKHQYLRGEL